MVESLVIGYPLLKTVAGWPIFPKGKRVSSKLLNEIKDPIGIFVKMMDFLRLQCKPA